MKTVFLDRDGTINRNLDNYVKTPDELEFLPNSLEAIKILTEAQYRVIVVTNQACVNKGIISEETLGRIHQQMIEKIEDFGGKIDKIYHCPHRSDENCGCRKPKPGMLLKAGIEHSIDFSESYLIGDSMRDIIAGKKVGAKSFLVMTGHGKKEIKIVNNKIKIDGIFPELYDVAKEILQ